MKILIIHNNPDSLYKLKRELVQELLRPHSYVAQNRLGANDVYLATEYREEIEILKCEGAKFIPYSVHRRSRNPFREISVLARLFGIIRKLRPDLVITYSIKPNLYGGLICRLLKIPFLQNVTGLGITFRDPHRKHRLIKWLYKWTAIKAHRVFFENTEDRDLFIREIGSVRAEAVPGAGINMEETEIKPYPKEDESVRFLAVMRVMREKGVSELLTAFCALKERYPNIHLQIVGEMFESAYEEKIRRLFEEGLLEYLPFQPRVENFMENCHCLVHPSYHEGMSNVIMEAAAMGRPVIASNRAGCREMIVDRKTGILVEAEDSDSLRRGMEEFIHMGYNPIFNSFTKQKPANASNTWLCRFFIVFNCSIFLFFAALYDFFHPLFAHNLYIRSQAKGLMQSIRKWGSFVFR